MTCTINNTHENRWPNFAKFLFSRVLVDTTTFPFLSMGFDELITGECRVLDDH